MEEISLDISGQTVSTLFESGRRTPVLLIHGNSSCKEIFAAQFASLRASGHAIVAPDLPGHGRSGDSGKPRLAYSFPGYAAVLRGMLSALDIRACHVVGWSLGGHIGIELWYNDPSVKSLLISGTPPIRLSPEGVEQGFLRSDVMDLAGKREFSGTDVTAYGSAMLGCRIDRRTRLARRIVRTDGRARYWMLRNGLAGVGTDEIIAVGSCDRPLAIVQGRSDPFVNVDYLQSLAYANLWTRRPILLESGHAPHFNAADDFNKYLKKFLKEYD